MLDPDTSSSHALLTGAMRIWNDPDLRRNVCACMADPELAVVMRVSRRSFRIACAVLYHTVEWSTVEKTRIVTRDDDRLLQYTSNVRQLHFDEDMLIKHNLFPACIHFLSLESVKIRMSNGIAVVAYVDRPTLSRIDISRVVVQDFWLIIPATTLRIDTGPIEDKLLFFSSNDTDRLVRRILPRGSWYGQVLLATGETPMMLPQSTDSIATPSDVFGGGTDALHKAVKAAGYDVARAFPACELCNVLANISGTVDAAYKGITIDTWPATAGINASDALALLVHCYEPLRRFERIALDISLPTAADIIAMHDILPDSWYNDISTETSIGSEVLQVLLRLRLPDTTLMRTVVSEQIKHRLTHACIRLLAIAFTYLGGPTTSYRVEVVFTTKDQEQTKQSEIAMRNLFIDPSTAVDARKEPWILEHEGVMNGVLLDSIGKAKGEHRVAQPVGRRKGV